MYLKINWSKCFIIIFSVLHNFLIFSNFQFILKQTAISMKSFDVKQIKL